MTPVDEFDTSKNAEIEAFCKSCHVGTLDTFHKADAPGSYYNGCLKCHREVGDTHEGWVNTAPRAGDFGRACTFCHTHGGYMPAHGACDHCSLNYDAKAF